MPSQKVIPATIVRLATLAGGETRRPIDPIADRSSHHQRKPERERDRIARERRERRQSIGNLDPEMAQRQPVVAGERKIAQRSEGEGQSDLIAARPGDRRLEFIRVDADQRAQKNDRGNGDNQDARRHAQPSKRLAMTADGLDQTAGE